MNTSKISRILNSNRMTKQKGIQSGYSLNVKEDMIEAHYFAFRAELSNERLEQISDLMINAGFQTSIIRNEDDDIHKVQIF